MKQERLLSSENKISLITPEQKALQHNLALMINCTYYIREPKIFQKTKQAVEEQGFELVSHSAESPDTNKSKFKAAAFQKDGKIYIVFAGSYNTIDFWHSTEVISQDILGGGKVPKANLIKKFVGNVIKKQELTTEDSILFSGHSLGGIFSQYAALEALSRGYTNLTCYNLSPLNSHKIITNAINKHNKDPLHSSYFSGEHPVEFDDELCINLRRPHDFIFTRGKHVGSVHEVPTHIHTEEDIGCWGKFTFNILGDLHGHGVESFFFFAEAPQ